jgi:plasmid maintenance system antidote protein VapI
MECTTKFFGVSAGFWMNLQLRWDLYHAGISEGEALKRIKQVKRQGD